jgi:SAM-dependent methyltransferase
MRRSQPGTSADNDSRIRQLYDSRPYLEAYAEHTDQRVAADPHEAVGGSWEEIGRLQFDYLVANGLQRDHALLDIGCGTLRGGRHFIRFLAPRRYTGIDLSEKAIQWGLELVRAEGLGERQPRLILNTSKDLRFAPFAGERFDFLLAQSVFTHLMPEHIEECFAHIGVVMHGRSVFFFTFREGVEFKRAGFKDFDYPFAFFENLAARRGFAIIRRDDYRHPRKQVMVEIKKG